MSLEPSHFITLTTSAMCLFRSMPARSRCERSPSPVNVGVKTTWPPPRSRSATRCQHQPPCQAPWTRTKVYGIEISSRMPGGIGGARLDAVALRRFDHPQQGAQHFGNAVTADGGDHERRLLRHAFQSRHLLFDLVGAHGVGLAQRQYLRFLRQAVTVGGKLRAHRLVRNTRILAGAVDQMQQHTAALDMTEEAVAEADAFMGAFDQAWNVGEHEFAAADVDHAELRMQCGERVIGDLRLGGADGGKKRRFAGIRQADNAGIGDQLQPQPDSDLGAGLAGIGVARRAVGRAFATRIAETAVAAMRQHDALAEFSQIREQRLAIFFVNLRTDRHFEHHVGAVGAMAILAHAAAAVLGHEMLLVAVVDQRVEAVDRLRHHVAAIAAVTAIRPAIFDEFFAPERHAAVAAVAGANVNLGFVEEFHGAESIRSALRLSYCTFERLTDKALV